MHIEFIPGVLLQGREKCQGGKQTVIISERAQERICCKGGECYIVCVHWKEKEDAGKQGELLERCL